MQRHELEAWLGDDHGLNEDQITELLQHAEDIANRYPDPDDQAQRDAALATAYRLMTGDEKVIEELAEARVAARAAEVNALAGLRQAAHMLIPDGSRSEAGFARQVGVDRQAIRKWLGKKD